MSDSARQDASGARTPAMVRVAAGFAVVFAVCFSVQSVVSLRHMDEARVIGWTWEASEGSWRVREVEPDGPAEGRLEPGDVILAVDGDPRIGTVGPQWVVRHAPPDRAYSVTVRRDGVARTFELRQRVRFDPSQRPWVVIALLTALVFAVTAMVIVLARPEDRAIRGGFWGSALIAFFYLWQSSRPYDGTLQGWQLTLQLLLGSTYPLYLWGGYRFFAAFPDNRPEQGRWKLFLDGILIGAWALWLPRTLINLVQIPRGSVVDLVHAGWWALEPYVLVGSYLETGILAVMVVGATLAMARNYRRLPEGVARRRIRWVAGALAGSALFVTAAAVVEAVVALSGGSDAAIAATVRFKVMSNAVAITMPLALTYAIVRHRVMGIHLVIRMGLRYLLAKWVLQAAVALPALWLAWTVLSNPDATVGELLFQGTGRINLVAVVLGVVLIRYRRPIRESLDRRFFREAYDQDQILIGLVDSIQELDSIQEIARTVSNRLEEALHVDRVVMLFRSEGEERFVVGYSTESSGARDVVPGASGLLTKLADARRPLRWDRIRPFCRPEEQDWLDRLELDLVVPILGVDQRNLVGVLMLGAKKSEEPYTPRDRTLLQAVTAQVGAVYEVLSLRARVSRDRRIQKEVLGRLGEQDLNLLKECPTCGRCYDRDDEECADDGTELELSLPVVRTVDARYHLQRLVGRGAMGAVFKAQDLRLGRSVAVKVMMGSLFGDQSAQRRFAREAHAAGRLVHPNIIRIYDFGELEGDGAYLVMEMVEGVTWKSLLGDGGIRRRDFIDVVQQLLNGMEAAHEAGVVHRDLKPDNILLTRRSGGGYALKILDFGLAKVREMGLQDPKSRTATGVVMGTVGYMSPEQFFGEKVDHRADVYSIAVMVLEGLTGPLQRKGYAVHEVIRRQLDERLRSNDDSAAAHAVADVLSQGLAWEREERFATVMEMRQALIPALEALPEEG